MKHRRIVLCAAAILASGVSGCRSGGGGRDMDAAPDVEESRAYVVVRNNHFSNLDIYAIGAGLNTRLGTVAGGTTKQYALSTALTRAPTLRIIGTPIGGKGQASTGGLRVSAGQTIHFTIASVLSQSSVIIE